MYACHMSYLTLSRAVQTPEELKTPTGEEAFNADGLVQRSIRLLKDRYPDLEVSCAPMIHMRGVASHAALRLALQQPSVL